MVVPQKAEKKYTYDDYASWPDDERWELIGGQAYNMTPAPSFRHQRHAGAIFNYLTTKLSGKPCVAGIAPTDIVLSKHDVVQPDVFVVCDKKKITDANIQGAPDLVIEILSPSTAAKDKREKKALYEKYGVKEYILVDPLENYAERFFHDGGSFSGPEVFGPDEEIPLKSLAGINIPLAEIFEIKKSES